jgi:hypothetical protein
MAKRRIVRAMSVSIRPGSALALMPREPIQTNATAISVAISTTSSRKPFRRPFTISLLTFLKTRRHP